MELTDHLRAIRKNWWVVVLVLAVTVAGAVLLTERATPTYASSLTFYVAASSETGTALQADEFAQRRINSYVGVLTSERLAERMVAAHDLGLDAPAVARRITAVANDKTILLTARVEDTDPDRAHAIASAIAAELGPYVQELERTEAATSANVSLTVISGPSVPTEPVSPDPTLNVGIGVLAGLALGVALAIARQMLDRSVRTAEDLAAATGLPTLAQIAAARRRRRADPADLVVVGDDPGSPRAESYRRLRTNLTFSSVTTSMDVVVVTSAVAGEGKTTTACNLAVTLAESGRRVLLVEADMRRPQVATYLGLEGRVGLTDVLVGTVDLADVVQPWGTDGLHVLAAGTLPPNPSELLGSEVMHALVARMRAAYDVVVLDTPPVLPVTDASVAAVHASCVVLVVRQGRTTRDQVRQAVEALRAVDAPVAGTVLNGAPLGRGRSADAYVAYADRGRRLGARRRRATSPAPVTSAAAARSAVLRAAELPTARPGEPGWPAHLALGAWADPSATAFLPEPVTSPVPAPKRPRTRDGDPARPADRTEAADAAEPPAVAAEHAGPAPHRGEGPSPAGSPGPPGPADGADQPLGRSLERPAERRGEHAVDDDVPHDPSAERPVGVTRGHDTDD